MPSLSFGHFPHEWGKPFRSSPPGIPRWHPLVFPLGEGEGNGFALRRGRAGNRPAPAGSPVYPVPLTLALSPEGRGDSRPRAPALGCWFRGNHVSGLD